MDATLGMVFDIKEFALYDGPGLRCTVFMKGCPLRCSWCHNPEGLVLEPEIMKTAAGERKVGQIYDADELAAKLLKYKPVFDAVGGGVTFSGGEPLLQAAFVQAVMRLLKGRVHLLLQTSGFAEATVFLETAALADLIFFDMKILDDAAHRRYTGVGNQRILANLERLDRSGLPYRLRFPMIPGITDTAENYRLARRFIETRLGHGQLLGLDLLPYNPVAGGKHAALGKAFSPGITSDRNEYIRPDFFRDIVKEVNVL